MTTIYSSNICILPWGIRNTPFDKYKLKRIDAFIEHIDYDVCILQEVWDGLFSFATIIREKLRKKGYYLSEKDKSLFINNGLLIASKFPILETTYYTFRHSAGLQWFIPNGILHCIINVNDIYTSIYSVHIHAGSEDTSFMNTPEIVKYIQHKQLEELNEYMKKHKYPYILGGDFNIDCRLDIHYLENVIGTSVLKQIGFPSTYPFPKMGNIVNPLFHNQETCVDHIITNIQYKKVEIVLPFHKLWYSDHAGVVLHL